MQTYTINSLDRWIVGILGTGLIATIGVIGKLLINDFKDLKGDFKDLRVEVRGVRGEIEGVREEIKGLDRKIDNLRLEIKNDIRELRNELKEDIKRGSGPNLVKLEK
jgi:hypothetical protein